MERVSSSSTAGKTWAAESACERAVHEAVCVLRNRPQVRLHTGSMSFLQQLSRLGCLEVLQLLCNSQNVETKLSNSVPLPVGKPVQLSASLEGVTCGPANAQGSNASPAGGASKAAAAKSPSATLEPCEKVSCACSSPLQSNVTLEAIRWKSSACCFRLHNTMVKS